MIISGAFSESMTLVVRFTSPTNDASVVMPPSSSPAPVPTETGPGSANTPAINSDTTEISPQAEALSKLGSKSAARADEVFQKLDADGDGSVTKQEFADNAGNVRHDLRARYAHGHHGRQGRHLDRLFSRIDANDDGTVSKDEIAARVEKVSERVGRGRSLERVFKNADANDDGAISMDELGALLRLKAAPPSAPAADPPTTTAESGDVPQTTEAPETTPASTVSITFTFSFTAIVRYQSASETTESSPVGRQVDVAA